MQRLKKRYQENIYGIIGTLLVHILLFGAILLANVKIEGKVKEEEILIDFPSSEEPEVKKEEPSPEVENTSPSENTRIAAPSKSNQAVNDAATKKDPFFDVAYEKEIAEAKKLVSDVNKQLSKEIPDMEKFEMPEQTTEGMDPAKISNTVYSGESNIHYNLPDRYHLRLPIPVYLAKGGGKINVSIWVSPAGKVIKAEVLPHTSITDPMLPEYALQAALRTVFNASPNAPSPQKGTITYTFIAQ